MKILLKTFSFLLIAGVMAGCSKINDENGGGSNWKPNLGDYDPVPFPISTMCFTNGVSANLTLPETVFFNMEKLKRLKK